MKNDVITIDITDLTFEGFGVGRHDGKVVFVADTAVGDRCEVLVMKELKSHSFARLLNVIEPSQDRITSDCDVCRKCGGCSFRHISYEAELKLKKRTVKEAFARIGGFDIEVNDTVFDTPDGYRNKVQYPFSADGNHATFGYYAHASKASKENISNAVQGWFSTNPLDNP